MLAAIAIIKDSFREALASRVLWVVLAAITMVLLALAPFGYRAERAIEIRGPYDLQKTREFAKKLKESGDPPGPADTVWKQFADEQRAAIEKLGASDDNQSFESAGAQRFVDALNAVIDGDDFYEKEAWKDVWLEEDVREFVDQPYESLSTEDRKRRNLLLLESAFPDHFRSRGEEDLWLTYYPFGDVVPIGFMNFSIDESQFKEMMLRPVVNSLIQMLLGTIAMLAAILVTSPIIPQMFADGSLHLLLSKPVRRSTLFLAKYAGGCAFISICVAYLAAGLWLILGARFEEWNAGVLYCIPIFVFQFALYYAVSAVAGVHFRKAVMCVVAVVVFWCACFTINFANAFVREQLTTNKQLVDVARTEDTFVARNETGLQMIWSEEDQQWNTIRGRRRMPKFVQGRMIVLDDGARVAAITGPPQAGFQFAGTNELAFADAESGWTLEKATSLPSGSQRLLPTPDGRLLVYGDFGLRDYRGLRQSEPDAPQVLGFELPSFGGNGLVDVGPEKGWRCPKPTIAAIDATDGAIAAYGKGAVHLLHPGADATSPYQLIAESELDVEDPSLPADLAIAGTHMVVARADGELWVLDAKTLDVQSREQPLGENRPRFVAARKDGAQFLVGFHDGRVLSWSPDSPKWARSSQAARGDISAARFFQDDTLAVVSRWDRVDLHPAQGEPTSKTPTPGTMQRVYSWVIQPLYWISPKPQGLSDTTSYALQQKTDAQLGDGKRLDQRVVKLNPWSPVRDISLYIVAILALGCLYIEWQDF